MLCPKCNQPVADGVRFCGSCGTALSAASKPEATLIRPPPPNNVYSAGGASAAAGAAAGGASAAWANVSAQMPGLVDRVKNILLTPKTEWPVIDPEPTTIAQLYKGYVMPLMGLIAVIGFLHMSVIGYSFGFGTYRTPLISGLVSLVIQFGVGLVMLYVYGLIIDGLAPTFAGQRDRRQALKVAAYSMTPAVAGTVLGLLPYLGPLLGLVAMIYGIYVLYLGLPILMKSPKDKAVGYTAAVIICGILVGMVLFFLIGLTTRITGFSPYGGMRGAMTQEESQERAAATVGAIIGGAMGTDQKGKDNLSAAINNLAAAGQQMEQQQRAANANGGGSGAGQSRTAPDAASAPPTAANVQSAAAATAGLLTALGGAMGGSVRHEPVDFHTLKDMLPASLPGMQRTNAEGSTKEAMGAKGSSATGEYQGQGGARVEIKIVDASAVSGLLSLAQSVSPDETSESDTGYEKNATVGGRMVHEKYDNRNKHGEISAIVAKRFGVDVTGDGVDMSTLEQIASQVDFSKLEAMKDAGAQPSG